MIRTKKLFILLVLVLCGFVSASAQSSRRIKPSAFALYADSVVNSFKQNLMSIELNTKSDSSEFVYSPYMYRASKPSTYYSKAIQNEFNIDWTPSYSDDNNVASSNGMIYRSSLNQMIDKALVGAYISNSDNFKYYDSQFNDVEIIKDVQIENTTNTIDELLKNTNQISNIADVITPDTVNIVPEKPNFWKKAGKFTTQFTQSYLSQNWYKGGNNNVTLLSTLLYECNYNDQNKVQWDNKLDLRLGFVSTPSDEFHKFMTNNDKIYLSSKLGVKATKAWFYTVQGDVNSQFMPGYRSNKKETFSRFLAPLDIFVSVGMDFKPTLKKGTLSVALLPLSYKYRLIGSDDDNFTIHGAYNMKKWSDGTYRNFQHDFGSKVEANFKIDIVKNLTWRSRFYYYTTYRYAESEWENAFSFQFNKYFSTEVNALWRFDDNRSPSTKEGHKLGYFQFKEYFTFGLAYNF